MIDPMRPIGSAGGAMMKLTYLKTSAVMSIIMFMQCSKDEAADDSPPVDPTQVEIQQDTTEAAAAYAQTGRLSLSSNTDGGASSDLVPQGLVNNAVGDVGMGIDNGDGTVSVAIPTIASKLNLQTTSLLLNAPGPSLYSTTVPNQCSGSQTNEGWKFACTFMQYVLDDSGESSQPNIFEDLLRVDSRMNFFITSLSGGRKPYCIVVEDSQLTNIKSLISSSQITDYMPDIYLSCLDQAEGPDSSFIDISFGRKSDTWYLMEHNRGSRSRFAALQDSGDVTVFDMTYDLYNGVRRGGLVQFNVQGDSGLVEYSQDNSDSLGCPKRAIWGILEGDEDAYLFYQHWRIEGDSLGASDDSCKSVAEAPVEEICVKMNELNTLVTVSSDTCQALKSKMTTANLPYRSDLSGYSESASLHADGKLDSLFHWQLTSALSAIKHTLFFTGAEETISTYDQWLGDARRLVQLNGTQREIESYSKAPCLRSAPVEQSFSVPVDLGFNMYLQCLDGAVSQKENGYTAFGVADDHLYTWYVPSTDSSGDKTVLSKISKQRTEMFLMERTESSFDSDYQDTMLAHLVANSATGVIEAVIAGIHNSGSSFGCGVQFKVDADYMYATGRFDSYRGDINWHIDADCSNVPVQTVCVDANTIKKTDLSHCRKRGLDFLSLKPIYPAGAQKDQSNAVAVDFSTMNDFFDLVPSSVTALGDRSTWGSYNNNDAQPQIDDPQYLIPFSSEHDSGPVNVLANCRLHQGLIDAGELRTTSQEQTSTFNLVLNDLPVPDKDALSVASGYDVVRVRLPMRVFGNEAVEPATTVFSGTVELSLVENGVTTSLGTVTVTKETSMVEFEQLLKTKDTVESLTDSSLVVTASLSAYSTCPEEILTDEVAITKDAAWGRAELSVGFSDPLLVY